MRDLKLNLGQKQSLVTSLSAAVAAFLLLILVTLATFILLRGSAYFWPSDIIELHYADSQTREFKRIYAREVARTNRVDQHLSHFLVSDHRTPSNGQLTVPENAILSNQKAGNVASILLVDGSLMLAEPIHLSDPDHFEINLAEYDALKQKVADLETQVWTLRHQELAMIHSRLAELDKRGVESDAPARIKLADRFYQLQGILQELQHSLADYRLTIEFADGQRRDVILTEVNIIRYPNSMSVFDKLIAASSNLWIFISDEPKLDNSTGGVFPALFGTIVMVLLMTVFVTPFGVLAAVYLHEYAPQTKMTSVIRIAVNNLAGVPSIVFGVFGLGFFVYTLGGNLDALFFEDTLPAPTFGAPGLFWASLTMAILTLPVVIVATEEGLRRVPVALRHGSYALGATQAETVFRTVLPIASPGIMTGVILAIARGAGEVAPLMLVGAVKFAPTLPVDGEFPFVHLQRQFMHLGVLIYDGAFHSQNVGNGSSFIFACCMLLLVVVLVLNLVAILIRNRLRRHYAFH